jgi:serine/threonine-protein kinase
MLENQQNHGQNGDMQDPAPPLPSGYEFVRHLGAGAYGDVALARHRTLSRQVAIKRILPRHIGDPSALDRFRREAQTLASTQCRSVVKVYDLIREGDTSYLVMEYVPGATLSDHIASGPVPFDVALRILSDVADALAAMAELGIIHRDIKPDNVFVLDDGSAKVGDFGLARMLNDPSIFKTEGPSDRGTPAYFPPEVSQGFNEPDARSDAYSFAVLAYQTLTGQLPHEAPNSIAMMVAHWANEPVPPAERLPGFPPSAAMALMGGLAKDPAARTMPSELVRQLEAVPPKDWPAVARAAPLARRKPANATPTPNRAQTSVPKPAPRRKGRRIAAFVVPLLVVPIAIGAEYWISR